MSWPVVVVFGLVWSLSRCGSVEEEDLDFSTLDVHDLASNAYGTELFLIENRYKDKATHRFEDFFWTGSGDGPDVENDPFHPKTHVKDDQYYKTKTIVTTVYIESPLSSFNETFTETPDCFQGCQASPTSVGKIDPSPTVLPTDIFEHNENTDREKARGEKEGEEGEEEDFFEADRQFWIVTVLRSDGKDPVITDLKNSLAKLYKMAFQRHQEQHLGIRDRVKRAADKDPVHVYIHQMDTAKINGDNKIEVLYHVAVDGKPVPAIIAANDMSLIRDDEVRRELGYPFLIKAEPYLKPAETQSLSSSKNTWIFIGASIIGCFLFLLMVAFLTLGLTKRKKVGTPINMGMENRQRIFERGGGTENKGFVLVDTARESADSPTYVNYKNECTLPRSVIVTSRPESSISSTSSSSSDVNISPLMPVGKRRTPPKKPPRPKAAISRMNPFATRNIPKELLDSDSSRSRKGSPIFQGNYDPGVISPKSYLSMPSVKCFPRTNMPEPLSKVLEPMSIHHLDMPDEEFDAREGDTFGRSSLIRHGSVGTSEDPGVIGPIVWNLHRQKLQHGVSVDQGIDDLNVMTNVSKMRKRFHHLLDDTFSLFGSRRDSPVDKNMPDKLCRPVPIEIKSHSAANTRSVEDMRAPTPKLRPKTTGQRRTDQRPSSRSPKGAWSSEAPSPLVRPLSAGVVNPYPRINVDHILAEGRFRANDPAIPLIAAIKSEIERVSLPGSTADLRD